MAALSLSQVAPMAAAAAEPYGLPPQVLTAQAEKESGLNPRAVSAVDATGQRAYGLCQFQLPTFRAILPGGNPLNPSHSLQAAAKYLGGLVREFGALDVALAAYNWGPAKVRRVIRAAGNGYEAIKARLPYSVRFYVWRIETIAATHAPRFIG